MLSSESRAWLKRSRGTTTTVTRDSFMAAHFGTRIADRELFCRGNWPLRLRIRAALLQIALEVACDRVRRGEAVGQVALHVVHPLLELLDERLHVGIARDGIVDLSLVLGGSLLERRGVDRQADEPLEAADQRERR